jgi:thiol-disulfide isomerase/thioredoxin
MSADKKGLSVSKLPSVMTKDLMDELPLLNEKAMILEEYRSFLNYYVNYFAAELNGFEKFGDSDEALQNTALYASKRLKGEPQIYILASQIIAYYESAEVETIKRYIETLEQNEKAAAYTEIVKQICEATLAVKVEKPKKEKGKKTKEPIEVNLETQNDNSKKLDEKDLRLMDIDGKQVNLKDFKGKVAYIDFWASWCGPCRRQFPFAKSLKEQLSEKQKKQVVFLYISIDDNEDSWRKAIKDYQLEGTQTISKRSWPDGASAHFRISSIPRYMIMDAKGNIVDTNAKRPSDPGALEDILKWVD